MMKSVDAVYDISQLNFNEDGVLDFYWPVSMQEIKLVRDTYLDTSVPFLRDESHSNNQALLLSLMVEFIGEVLVSYQAQALICRAKRDGRQPVFSSGATLSNAFLANKVPSNIDFVSRLENGIVKSVLWKSVARNLRGQLMNHTIKMPFLRSINSASLPVTVSTGDMIRQHAAAVGGVNYVDLSNWFYPLEKNKIGKFASPLSSSLLDTLMDHVKNAFVKGNESLGATTERYLREWLECVYDLVNQYVGRLFSKPKTIPKTLWRGTGGLIWSRMLSLAVIESGGAVVGHEHSAGQGSWITRRDTVVEYPFSTQYMVASELARKMSIRNSWPSWLVYGDMPIIATVPGVFKTKTLSLSLSAVESSADIRNIMYVGSFYSIERFAFNPLFPSPVLVDWEARIISYLTSKGYRVIFKPHPEATVSPERKLMTSLGAIYEDRAFSEVIDKADVLLLAMPHGTPFYQSIGTSKPIVFPNSSAMPWQPEIKDMLMSRCGFSDSYLDEGNRLHNDWDLLGKEIRRSINLKNDDYFNRYFLNSESGLM